MRKGFKQRMSILLAAAMVFTMNTPVLASEDLLSPDEVLVQEDSAALLTETEDSNLLANDEAEDEDLAKDSSEIPSADIVVGKIKDLLGHEDHWTIKSLSNNTDATADDYAYSSSTNTITIKNNPDNTVGLVISPKVDAATASTNLIIESDVSVPVTVSTNSHYIGVATLNVTNDEPVKLVYASEGTLVLSEESGTAYNYIAPGGPMTTGTYLVARKTAMSGLEAFADDENNNAIKIDREALGLAKMSGSGTLDIDSSKKNVLNASGDGTYAVVTGALGKATAVKTLTFKTLTLGSERVGTISDDSITSDTITGNVENTVSGQFYEVAGFDSSSMTKKTAGPVEVENNGSFTLRGLSDNSAYYLAVRQVSGNKLFENGIAADGILYIPSTYNVQTTPVTTKKSEYEVDNADGSQLKIVGTGTAKTADMYKVVINGNTKYTDGGTLILTKGKVPVSGNVVWESTKPSSVLVNPVSGAVSIASGAKDGDIADIIGRHDGKSAKVTVTVKIEGGSLSANDLSGNVINSLKAVTGEEAQFKVTYPESMASGLTLSEASIVDKDVVASVSAGTIGSTSTLIMVKGGNKKGTTSIKIPAYYKASNGKTYTEELALDVAVTDKPLEFKKVGVNGAGKYYIYYNTYDASVVAPYEGVKFKSDNSKVATISENSGLITPVNAGEVKFYAISGNDVDTERWSDILYVVDDRAKVTPSSTFVTLNKDFKVTASFPSNYYEVTNIALKSTTNPAISAIGYSDGTLSLNVLSQNKLSSNEVKLVFTVTAKSDITGETSKTVEAETIVKITSADGHEGDPTPDTGAGVVDISADKFKAYQVESALDLWDANASTTVYFVGNSADPDYVTGDNEKYDYETVAGNGYTKVIITLNDKYKKWSEIESIYKNGKKINFTLKLGDKTNTSTKITLKVNKNLPKVNLTNKSGTAYADADGKYNAVFMTEDKNGIFGDEDTEVKYVKDKNSSESVENIDASIENNAVKIEFNDAEAQKNGGLYITNKNWVDGAFVFAPFKITKAKATAKPTLKLGKTSATIGTGLGQSFSTPLIVNGGMVLDGVNDLTVDKSYDGIHASIADGYFSVFIDGAVKAGKYVYTIDTSDDSPVKAKKAVKFTLNVTDKEAKVSYTVKGKLDSVADDTAVYVIPKLSNANSGDIDLTEDTYNALAAKQLTATVENGIIKIVKDETQFDTPVQYIPKGALKIDKFEIVVGEETKVSKNISIPVVLGKLTATGTAIDFRGVDATEGKSAIEAIYTYSIYNAAGKVERKSYYTFAGSQLTLKDAKAGKLTVSAGNDGLVTVKNKDINGKDYNGSVKTTINGTTIKDVTAKFKVLGKIKK